MMRDDTLPSNADEMRAAILARYDGLSKRLQQIARFVLDEPNDVALETLAVIAGRSGVQPSAIVRFAKTFGFDGATQMQRLFRDGLLNANVALGYSERVRRLGTASSASGTVEPGRLLAEFVEGNVLALNNLAQGGGADALDKAVSLMVDARTIHVTGFRRSFPVASYLAYSLLQVGKPTVFVDGVGGLARSQAGAVGEGDLLIAVSYAPYAEEAVDAVATAAARGGAVLAITDSLVSPIAQRATAVLQVREAEVRGFRSLSASMCLAQALLITFAARAIA